MILTRTPFRVSFVGGGTDLPFFYKKCPGAVISTSIDKYMFIFVHQFFDKNKIQLKYSKVELVESADQLEHPIAREVLKRFHLDVSLDINSIADIPSGTGLGSSSAYTVGLLHALYAFGGQQVSKEQLAEEAAEIEIYRVGSPIGKQDQYAASFGGLNLIEFFPDDTTKVTPILWDSPSRRMLEDSIMVFYVAKQRDANQILTKWQSENAKFMNLIRLSALTYQFRNALLTNDIESCGKLLHEGWLLKKEVAQGISDPEIDVYYNLALQNGAYGGKLLGAGGGGFLMFLVPPEKKGDVRKALANLREFFFRMDKCGSSVLTLGA